MKVTNGNEKHMVNLYTPQIVKKLKCITNINFGSQKISNTQKECSVNISTRNLYLLFLQLLSLQDALQSLKRLKFHGTIYIVILRIMLTMMILLLCYYSQNHPDLQPGPAHCNVKIIRS